MTLRPLRVRCGSGEPQREQKVVAKLCALGRSKRAAFSCPEIHENCFGRTRKFDACALPVALRQREQ
jgi:hypothetical protein